MHMTKPILWFFLAAGFIAYIAFLHSLHKPLPLSFEQRWAPVKFIVPFTRGA